MAELNQREAFLALENKINNHIGSNGYQAHLPADIDRSGFMTPNQVLKLNKALGEVPRIDDGTDVLALPAGPCWGVSLKNSPVSDDSIMFYNVQIIDDTHKLITAMQSVTGKIYVMNIHNDNAGSPICWTKMERYNTLWSGYVGDAGTKLTLTEPLSKYYEIRVLIDNGNGQQEYKRLRLGGASTFTISCNHTWSTGDSATSGYNNTTVDLTISGKVVTIKSNVNIVANLNGDNTVTNSLVKIKTIEGVV